MTPARRFHAAALSSLVVLTLWTSAIAQTPYPPALDYGISQHLARAPAACLKLPIDGGSRPHTHDKGAENQPRQQQAIDAVQQIVGLGLMESVPSNIPGYREYRITDVAAYDGRGSFCYGREVLTRIISIGPPRSLGPICVREAEVLTEFRDIPAWMDRPSLAPYVENRAAWKSARSKTIELQRDGKRWTASERYDPIHSNWLGPRSFDACKAHR